MDSGSVKPKVGTSVKELQDCMSANYDEMFRRSGGVDERFDQRSDVLVRSGIE